MIEQMVYVFEDQTHELHTKSGLFIFFRKKKCSSTTKRLPAVIILSSINAGGTK